MKKAMTKNKLPRNISKQEDEDPLFLIVDLFCGFGGTTTGFAEAEINGKKICKIIACINHDPKAIRSHWLNHKEVKHFEEDIRSLDLSGLVKIVEFYRNKYPLAKLILWASLECTNFSKAKGGQERDADSRTLAHSLHMKWDDSIVVTDQYHDKYINGDSYIQLLNPDYIQIENVVEFKSWGEMLNGKPISRDKGIYYMRWCNDLCKLGYKNDWREINSADLGAFTSRNRLFGCFAKNGLPLVWPELTHSKVKKGILFGDNLKPWKAVKEVLDFEVKGESIFIDLIERPEKAAFKYMFKPLKKSKKTGKINYPKPIVLFPASLINPLYGMNPKAVITYEDRAKWDEIVSEFKKVHGEVKFYRHEPYAEASLQRVLAGLEKFIAKGDKSYIAKYYSGRPKGKVISIDGPAGTITTADGQSLVQPEFLTTYHGHGDNVSSIDNPAPTIPCKDSISVVQPEFIINFNHSSTTNDIDKPAPTITAADKLGVVQPEMFIEIQYGNSQIQSVNVPLGTIMPNDKHRLVQPEAFIIPTDFNNKATSIEAPLNTITASKHYHYIVNPSYGGHMHKVDDPCPVIVARQDKAPLSMIEFEGGLYSIAIFDTDSEVLFKIKVFMATYGLVDIKMRMLMVSELLKIQGFPVTYEMVGDQSDHKKFIGNSVHPLVPKAWAEAFAPLLYELLKAA